MNEAEKFLKRKNKVLKVFENYFKPEMFTASWEKEGVQVTTNIYNQSNIDNF